MIPFLTISKANFTKPRPRVSLRKNTDERPILSSHPHPQLLALKTHQNLKVKEGRERIDRLLLLPPLFPASSQSQLGLKEMNSFQLWERSVGVEL
jgi:hypothetical protein